MMPRLPSLVLRRTGTGAALLGLIVLCLALPVRHLLLAPWPERIEEILTEADGGRVERRFVPAGSSSSIDSPVVARSQPITLWRLETDSGEVTHAWLAGARDGQDQLLPGLPAWLENVRVEGPLSAGLQLVVITAAGETLEVDGASVRRLYRPNSLSSTERIVLWFDRLEERWAWPVRLTADARMTPPAQ